MVLQVIRQHADGQGLKRVHALHPPVGRAQTINMFHQGSGLAIRKGDGEKEGAARNQGAAVS